MSVVPTVITSDRPGRAHPACREQESDPRLRELTVRAHALIHALRGGARFGEQPSVLTSYVVAARAAGVVGERLHDALELLVHEHARSDVSAAQGDAECARTVPGLPGSAARCGGRKAARNADPCRPATAALLRDLLRLADPNFRVGHCAHGATSTPGLIPHWCRLRRHPR